MADCHVILWVWAEHHTYCNRVAWVLEKTQATQAKAKTFLSRPRPRPRPSWSVLEDHRSQGQASRTTRLKIIVRNVFGSINILLTWWNTSVMLSIDMQFMLDEEKLPFSTWRPSGLTPWQIWWSPSVCETGSFAPFLGLVWCTHPIVLWTRNSSGDEIANVNFLYDDIVHVLQNTIAPPPQTRA